MMGIDIGILDGSAILLYLVMLVWVGVRMGRKPADAGAAAPTSEELFLSSRSLPWYKVGLSIFSTNVSPSMLVAYFGAAYSTGMVLANFEWMAWFFLLLLSYLFIPWYLRHRISTMPEFLMKRFGSRAHRFHTYFSMFGSLVIWSSFMLCIGGKVILQLTGIPILWSVLIIVVIALSYSVNGGLSAIVNTGMIQSVVLLGTSLAILALGLWKAGGIGPVVDGVPEAYWSIFRPTDDAAYPWHAILLGYPVIGIWFWCTDQSIVQRTLAAKDVFHGQLGAWLVALLKVIMPFIFILPGIVCLVLVGHGRLPALENPDHAYITMVKGLLPAGLVGLALATLMVSIINDVATGISAFSTVFALDFYGKRIRPDARPEELGKVGKRVSVLAGVVSAGIAMFFASSDKGLFELGQSLGTYLAPPISTVFLLGMLWKRATPRAAELTLYIGTALCLTIGFCQLKDFPSRDAWPHFMLLCFYMMLGLTAFMVIVSLLTRPVPVALSGDGETVDGLMPDASRRRLMRILWAVVAVVMAAVYIIFR
jgi:SSS family solute:Na+ symporter